MDILNVMEAPVALMNWKISGILKEMRGQVNRQVQLRDGQHQQDGVGGGTADGRHCVYPGYGGTDSLPPNLEEIAKARLESRRPH